MKRLNPYLFLFLNFFHGSFLNDRFILPTSVLIIASLSSLFMLVFYRLLVKELFVYLKNAIHSRNVPKGVLAATGTTSTVAMISCCTHYLVNILPILGVTGLVTLVGQYQTELFWFGILSNLLGIAYISHKIYLFHKTQRNEN